MDSPATREDNLTWLEFLLSSRKRALQRRANRPEPKKETPADNSNVLEYQSYGKVVALVATRVRCCLWSTDDGMASPKASYTNS